MSDIYIVGFDGTEQSRRAGEFAAETAKKSGAKLHVFMVLEWSPYSFHTPEELAERKGRREEELKRAEADVQPFADKLKKTGVEVSTEVHHGNAGDLLCQSAKDKDASQIFIGRTGTSSLAARLLGGLAVTLAQVAPVPLTIVP